MLSPLKIHANSKRAQPARLQRTHGIGRVAFKSGMALVSETPSTRLDKLFQQGSARIKLPKTYDNTADVVLINTAGGMTGGDKFEWDINTGRNTQCVITTQACEKIYRTIDGPAKITTNINIAEGASVDWLPQETILFNKSALKRELHVDMAPCARFIAIEAVILGRSAMGEVVTTTNLHERWRISRDGLLVHGEDFRLAGDIENLVSSWAVLNGNIAFASLVYVGPEDPEQMQQLVKGYSREKRFGSGFSIFNGKITARFSARDGYSLRKKLIAFLTALRGGKSLPKSWSL